MKSCRNIGGFRARTILGVALLMVLTACGGPGATGGSGFVDTDATLRFGASTMPASWDPHLQREAGENKTLFAVWDRLTMLDSNNDVQPAVAASWEFSPDGRTMTLAIRAGLTFHNGDPIDSTSVKVSLERARSLPRSTVAGNLAVVDSIEAPSPTTVVLQLNGPGAQLPAALALGAGTVIDAKALQSGVDIGSDPNDASSGPYVVSAFVPDESVILSRAPGQYWDAAAGQFASIEVTKYLDPNAAVAALKTGAIDMMNDLMSAEDSEASIVGTGLVHTLFPVQTSWNFYMNPRLQPTADRRVRQAILMGVDRKTIGSSLFGEEFVNSQIFAPNRPGHIDGYDPYPYNPGEAKRLLAEAGQGSNMNLQILIPAANAFAEGASLAVQQQLKEIGVNVTIEKVASQDFPARWANEEFPVSISAFAGDPIPYNVITRNALNIYRLVAPDVQGPLSRAMANSVDVTLGDDKREAAAEESARIVTDSATWGPMAFRQGHYISTANVRNVESQPWASLSDSAADFRYLQMTD